MSDSKNDPSVANAVPLTYRDAGVDINAGNTLVERIKPAVQATRRPEVLSGIGGFGGLFAMPKGYVEPVLVSGTDGVGTKLKLALQQQQHDGVGIDLVAMCVNDIIVTGAEPLFFLDYYATGALDVEVATTVVEGIAEGCKLSGAALVGGETAEMPGMYSAGDYDLAGFSVGVVERSKIIDGSKVQADDVILGLASSGPHSNGYSLIRKVLERAGSVPEAIDLLAPTHIYVKSLLQLFKQVDVHACAHITGGGITENLPRVLPENTQAVINPKAWDLPKVFAWLQQQGSIADDELYRTFNCGIGMAVVVDAKDVDQASQILTEAGETVFEIGRIQSAIAGAEPLIYS